MIVFVEKNLTPHYINHLHFSISNTKILPSHLPSLPPNKLLRTKTHTPQKPYIIFQQKEIIILNLQLMHANLKPFSLMGFPNKIEKDLHVITTRREVYGNCLQDTNEILLKAESVSTPPLRIKVPPIGGGVDGGDDGGCSTPKAEDHGGEVILPKCPPPPRKPKSAPLLRKRKVERVLLDLSSEIDSMFPSNIMRDFMCGKIKKIRREIL